MLNQPVIYRYIRMPCCGYEICWIANRFPSHCPECGKSIYPQVRNSVLFEDDNASLKLSKEPKV